MVQAVTDAVESSFQTVLEQALKAKSTVKVLEAGCGSLSRVHIVDKHVHVTGIDISQKQLDRNLSLDEKIRADIQFYEFQPSSYDVIVCWDVLEHLPQPVLALRGFARAVSEGGLIILAVPNVLSIKGLVTKYTPYPVHVWTYKWLHRRRSSVKDDSGPFRTYLRYSIRPGALRQFARQNGLRVVYFETNDVVDYDWFWQQNSNRARTVRSIYKAFRTVGSSVSFGALGESDFFIALQKPANGKGGA